VYDDLVPFTNGVLRAYSQYTNTWASVALATLPSTSLKWAPNVAVQKDGLHYHAYSAYTGQWVTLDVAVEGGIPFIGPDYAAVDLRGTSGPFQYAAFSALRGKWTLSPVYPSTGAGLIASQSANALAIKTNAAGSKCRYTGHSPISGAWTTSSFVHSTSATQSGLAFKNALRVQDTDTSVRFELFGAGNGIWQGLAGTNLVEESLHDDFHVVKDATDSASTLYLASAMVGGGYLSLALLAAPATLALDIARTEPDPVEILTAIEVDAPRELVWRHVVSFAELPEPDTWLFRTGVAYPLRATIDGSGVGAVRHCEFTTGAFVEPITAWEEPSRLAFDVAAQPPCMQEWSFYAHVHPPHLDDGLRSRRGEFRLVELPGGRTRLEGRTWYVLRLHPAWYWTPWAEAILHRIHLRVLAHVKRLAESEKAP
jgi:hypothetical protein